MIMGSRLVDVLLGYEALNRERLPFFGLIVWIHRGNEPVRAHGIKKRRNEERKVIVGGHGNFKTHSEVLIESVLERREIIAFRSA